MPQVPGPARAQSETFPAYFGRNFDYAEFMRYDSDVLPETGLYQSNGYLALRERGFGSQTIQIPAATGDSPDVRSDVIPAVTIEAPTFEDRSGHHFRFASSPGARQVRYYADRTRYRVQFANGPTVILTAYPVYGQPAAVLRLHVQRSSGPLSVEVPLRSEDLHRDPGFGNRVAVYESPLYPCRVLVTARSASGSSAIGKVAQGDQTTAVSWRLKAGEDAVLVFSAEASKEGAAATLDRVTASSDQMSRSTRQAWNSYLATVPLVAPAAPISYTIATTGESRWILPEELVRSELWQWRGLLTNTVQASRLPAAPLVVADWERFMGMWSNDGIAEAIALASTSRSDLARASILQWFRYAVNDLGDGYACWTIFPSGRTTRQGAGPERDTEAVPLSAALVGLYVRKTGDRSILDERPGGRAGQRTIWQALEAYEHNLLGVRDRNHDMLLDWTHMWESGWDDKNSPFVDLKPDPDVHRNAYPCGFASCRRFGAPTSAINEQAFHLLSLEEMAWLARLRGEDASEWTTEFQAVRDAVRKKLWDNATRRYWDMDAETDQLWTRGENLDAYYLLTWEPDPARIEAMMRRLNDPAKFNGALLPTMAFDTPAWGGYWRGLSWPREYSHLSLALSRAGYGHEALRWLARGIITNRGPVLPENISPKNYPHEYRISDVRIMGYDALDAAVLPDIAGLRTWDGQDLTVHPDASLGKLYVRGVRWQGHVYDAIFTPHQPVRIWRNGVQLQDLPENVEWKVASDGSGVQFSPDPETGPSPAGQ